MSQTPAELRIGFLGAGFIANFHLQSLLSVRRCRLSAVWSPSAASRDALADKANSTDLGPCKSYETIEQLVDSGVDAIWIMGPNDTRVETVERIVACVERQRKTGSSSCIALACEKPLARTVKEAERMLELVEGAGLLHGYLGWFETWTQGRRRTNHLFPHFDRQPTCLRSAA
jgi:predicted dehydrogenase